MKSIRIFLLLSALTGPILCVQGQASSLAGNWQLVKEGNCLDESPELNNDSLNDLRDEMHTRSGATPQIIQFKANSTGEESTRILSKGKSANAKKFLYKFNGEMLLILDKKSQTISDSYIVDKFNSDSLIVSNSSRPCETRIFVKINQDTAN